MLARKLRINDLIADPFSKILYIKKWATPFNVFLLFLFIGIVDEFLIGTMLGHWNSTPTVVGVFDINNISMLIISLVVEPGFWAYYVWYPKAAIRFFNTLENKHIVLTEQSGLISVQNFSGFGSSPVFRALAIVIAALISLFAVHVIKGYSPSPWFYYETLHFYTIGILRIFISAYVAVYSALWNIMAVFTISAIFTNAKIDVRPYHEDNAGGLAFVGKFIMSVSTLTLILVPFIISEILFALRLGQGITRQENVWLEVTILPLLLAIMIFLPVKSCRDAMIRAREDAMQPFRANIAAQVQAISASTDANKEKMGDLNALIDLRLRLDREFPTWPFNVFTVQQFGTTFIISLIPITIEVVRLFLK